ncbi:MAG: TetR family transcriptional regulator [Propionicimonas sp.]
MPKIVDHEQRRAAIVLALWLVISARGIEGVTYQAVAAAAGVSVGHVQHYFASKDELIRAGCWAMVDGATDRHSEQTAGSDPRQALFDLLAQPIPRTEAFRLGAAVWYAYLARGVVDPGIGAIVAEASRGTVTETASLLDAAGLPTTEAERLVSLSNGLTQRVLVGAVAADDALAVLYDEISRLRPAAG